MSLLSNKNIAARERLIFALDVDSADDAKAAVERLGDSVEFYKIGLSLLFSSGFWDLFEFLKDKGKKSFADIKFFDVPETVRAAVAKVVGSGAAFATVHAQEAMIQAALEARGSASDASLKILAVTVLTSLDSGDLNAMGFSGVSTLDLVLSRAGRMLGLGCDGVISSGLEVPELRKKFGENFLIVVPGIRPVENTDDQKRTVDVEGAFQAGADYIVVGRPIRQAADPKHAAESIQRRIAALFPASE